MREFHGFMRSLTFPYGIWLAKLLSLSRCCMRFAVIWIFPHEIQIESYPNVKTRIICGGNSECVLCIRQWWFLWLEKMKNVLVNAWDSSRRKQWRYLWINHERVERQTNKSFNLFQSSNDSRILWAQSRRGFCAKTPHSIRDWKNLVLEGERENKSHS